MEITQDVQNKFIGAMVEIDYRNSFVYDENFEGKRFNKYVQKTKDYIYENYLKIVYPLEDENGISFVHNFDEQIINFFCTYYLTDTFEEHENTGYHSIFNCFNEYAVPDFDSTAIDGDFLEKFLMSAYKNEIKNETYSLGYIIESETRLACKEHIRRIVLKSDNIDETNYFLTLPQSVEDAILILDDILNRVKIDIEKLCKSQIVNEAIKSQTEGFFKGSIERLQKENNSLNQEIEKLNNIIQTKENDIKNLNTKLSTINEKNNEYIDILLSNIRKLERQNTKIKGKYERLLDKYKALKENSINDVEDIENDIVQEFNELDLNGKYLFIAYNDITFQNTILQTFTNATFSDTNANINSSSTDMVIVLTAHIDHSVYYGIKEQCKTKNIPLIHCNFSNVELIKELMFDAINR